ncbi:MAG TPA: PilZ domain-containing protein [Holophaga sp.]|jgi:hypothetical protein|nr:PilZ domain-containing protein [Holophaga sp.]
MTSPCHLIRSQIEDVLNRAKSLRAPASLRPVGSPRLMGDLEICGLETGATIHLAGAKRRDQVPPVGTDVTLSVLVGDEVITGPTVILDPIISTEGDTLFPPILRVAWLERAVESHRRRDVRVATLDLPPLQGTMIHEGLVYGVSMLNLTETGLGVGYVEGPIPLSHAQVRLEVVLPGGVPITATAEVRHAERLDHDPMPIRIGLVFLDLSDDAKEALSRFVQARRTDRSVELRKHY